MDEALRDMPVFREFAKLASEYAAAIPCGQRCLDELSKLIRK